ncbi:hypothetical protein KSP40_PGU019971 [Platanthera guangdongensis]|uniref:BAG domain-containing protein n=1 Tax=Platanthera guangdongensis TaxID=2320717 RepID=A0ABR2MMB9_9ASPA
MADSSFYNHNWNPARYGSLPQIRPFSSKPKVVNIPVNFVSSDEASLKKPSPPTTVSAADRKAAAIAIQKAVRGFLVRMNARAVRQIAMEVSEIERKVREEEVKIRMDIKARIRVSEELMALLLRLDSVRWVRDLRKKMIRRVMALQEAIDSISAAADGNSPTIDIPVDLKGSVGESVEESSIHQTMEPAMELEIEIPSPEPAIDDHEVAMGMENPAAVESINMETGEEGTGSKSGEPSEELRGLKVMMERMAGENCQTSAEQCRLMEGLAGRVSNLEHVVHRMDRRKKSRSGAAARQ